jgi:uncharacterized alpha-E superfamily protein
VEQQWRPLLIISGIHDYAQNPTAENVQEFMTWDADNPCSIVRSLAAARENARIIREVISAEMWERLNYYHLWIQSPAARASYESNRTDFYAQIRRINQLIYGIAAGTMSHGEAWEFSRLGRNLERASQTARIMDVKYHTLLPRVEEVGTPIDNAHWVAILMSCSGYEPYHKKSRSTQSDPGISIAEFLIYDDLFPRSIRRCIQECRWASAAISGVPVSVGPANETDHKIEELLEWLDTTTIHSIIKAGLHESLTYVVNTTSEIGEAVYKSYFDPPLRTPGPKTLMKQKQTQS